MRQREPPARSSFAPATPVATPSGEQAIGSLAVGDTVTAYDPTSGKTSTQTVQHVFLNHDTDLLDVAVATADTSGQHTKADEHDEQGAAGGRGEPWLARSPNGPYSR